MENTPTMSASGPGRGPSRVLERTGRIFPAPQRRHLERGKTLNTTLTAPDSPDHLVELAHRTDPSTRPLHAAMKSGQTAGSSVLVVDDDASGARMAGNWLNEAGYTVSVAATVAEALTDDQRLEAEVVLVALSVTEPSGRPAGLSAIARFPEASVIVISDRFEDDRAEALIRAGAQDHLGKDRWTSQDLVRAVRFALARQQANQHLYATTIELAQTNAELHDFAHTVARDLRSPARLARSLIEGIGGHLDTEPHAAELGRRATEVLARMDDIAGSMLEYTSLQADPPRTTTVDLAKAIEAAIERASLTEGIAPSAVRRRVADDLDVSASAKYLRIVVEHLLSNASVHHPDRAQLGVTIDAESVGDRVRIRIADNGAGIPPHARERVFEPLERLSPEGPGSGLGLAICRRIVQTLGGSIWIEPTDGSGTVVVVELARAY